MWLPPASFGAMAPLSHGRSILGPPPSTLPRLQFHSPPSQFFSPDPIYPGVFQPSFLDVAPAKPSTPNDPNSDLIWCLIPRASLTLFSDNFCNSHPFRESFKLAASAIKLVSSLLRPKDAGYPRNVHHHSESKRFNSYSSWKEPRRPRKPPPRLKSTFVWRQKSSTPNTSVPVSALTPTTAPPLPSPPLPADSPRVSGEAGQVSAQSGPILDASGPISILGPPPDHLHPFTLGASPSQPSFSSSADVVSFSLIVEAPPFIPQTSQMSGSVPAEEFKMLKVLDHPNSTAFKLRRGLFQNVVLSYAPLRATSYKCPMSTTTLFQTYLRIKFKLLCRLSSRCMQRRKQRRKFVPNPNDLELQRKILISLIIDIFCSLVLAWNSLFVPFQ